MSELVQLWTAELAALDQLKKSFTYLRIILKYLLALRRAIVALWATCLAHLSRRLIGELIVYAWSGVHRQSIVRPSSTMLKHLLLRNRFADQSQILHGASLGWGNESLSRHHGHMTKMATMPIYCKNPSKIFFSGTDGTTSTKLGM